jgi:hypothetical protein
MTKTKPALGELAGYELERVDGLSEQDLDFLQDAIRIRRHLIMAARLAACGLQTRLNADRVEDTYWFDYIMVYDPTGDGPAVFADLDECRRLLDTVANLLPADAFARWQKKVKPMEEEEYTEQDARRDTRAARQQLRDRLADNSISSREFADHYRSTSFTDLYPAAQQAAQDQVTASKTGIVWATVQGRERAMLYEGSLAACHAFARNLRNKPAAAGLEVIEDDDAYVEAHAAGDPLEKQDVWSE